MSLGHGRAHVQRMDKTSGRGVADAGCVVSLVDQICPRRFMLILIGHIGPCHGFHLGLLQGLGQLRSNDDPVS